MPFPYFIVPEEPQKTPNQKSDHQHFLNTYLTCARHYSRYVVYVNDWADKKPCLQVSYIVTRGDDKNKHNAYVH